MSLKQDKPKDTFHSERPRLSNCNDAFVGTTVTGFRLEGII